MLNLVSCSRPPVPDTQWLKRNSGWGGVGGAASLPLAPPSLPPCPPWQHSRAGTEPRSGGGVRLMLNRVN